MLATIDDAAILEHEDDAAKALADAFCGDGVVYQGSVAERFDMR